MQETCNASENDTEQIRAGFRAIAKIRAKGNECKTPEEWEYEGALIFKRRVLGFCGYETTKSIDDLAKILVELKAVGCQNAGKTFTRKLYNQHFNYGDGMHHLTFRKVEDSKGKEYCRISKMDGNF